MENTTNRPPKPDNYLVWAILSTVFCCIATGIPSIIYAAKVNEAYERGEYDAAQRASKNAKTWAMIGPAIAIFIWIIYFAIFGFAIIGGAMSSGDF
ncbi:MAG: CD225/dispanin family protein [Croceitalea sp.]|nr:CD225/dispanin family protein [Croceitalea sp.]MBT8237064.1 CD225/dispanin family protein [Croceitalea sp.]NNC33441.1 CD225/dispanin family protein [Croceitalea sp.]NNL08021.1 CD225/dispanin family protein [Croceitalea sp.]NNM17483.1 CD225/dispanin family protein [Croceitalea sp.]